MDVLDAAIEELLELEPFWRMCYPCQHHGYCCLGAEVRFTDEEWENAQCFIRKLPLKERLRIRANKKRGLHCVYRAPGKCLIHPVRPMNCRYTPFQVVVYPGNIVKYSMMKVSNDGRCEGSSAFVRLTETQYSLAHPDKFLLLPNFERQTLYLSLNWLVEQLRLQ